MDLDLRKLRYFVTVAECASFRAAAQQLHVAQPALSRQIRALEADLGVVLFVRTGRGVELTPDGRRVLHDGRSLLQSSAAMVRRVRQAASVGRTFAVGFRPGVALTALARRFQQSHPRLALELVVTSPRNQEEVVSSGRVGVSLVRGPCQVDELERVPLFEEPRVVVVAADHPIATLGRVSLHELRWLGLLQAAADVPELGRLFPDEAPARPPATEDGTFDSRAVERFERVAAGQGALVVPRSVASIYRRPDLASVALDGAEPSEVFLLRRRGADDPLIQDFTRLALTLLSAARPNDESVAASL